MICCLRYTWSAYRHPSPAATLPPTNVDFLPRTSPEGPLVSDSVTWRDVPQAHLAGLTRHGSVFYCQTRSLCVARRCCMHFSGPFGWFPLFGSSEESCCDHLFTRFCKDVCVQCLLGGDCGSRGNSGRFIFPPVVR